MSQLSNSAVSSLHVAESNIRVHTSESEKNLGLFKFSAGPTLPARATRLTGPGENFAKVIQSFIMSIKRDH